MQSSVQITHVVLRVPNLEKTVEFYVRHLGFAVIRQTNDRVELAATVDGLAMLTLVQAPGAPRARPDAAGLFHAAVLFPSRPALASWLAFAAARQVEFEGFSDHGVSDAIYLSDPDGNGLEFYADRPRSQWPFVKGELAMTTRTLSVRDLLNEATPTETPLHGATWGHLHLRVTDLERSEAFYCRTFNLEVTQRSYPGALFLAAEGYHHHVGLNTWGNPRLPQPPDSRGLVEATFAQAGADAETLVTDPDGIQWRVQPLRGVR